MYDSIERMIGQVRTEAESSKTIMETVEREATDLINELESVKQDAEDTAGELGDYITNLDGLEALIEKAQTVRDEAENQHIVI